MSNDAWMPLFAQDAARWEQITLDHDPARRIAAVGDDLREILAGPILRFANTVHPRTILDIRKLYRASLKAGMPVEHRRHVLMFIAGAVQHTRTCDVGAYVPFMVEEPDRGIASTAAIDYASLGSLIDNDPMARPKEIIRLIESADCENNGALFGGLLCLGDPRVCRLLKPLIGRLSLDEACEAASCTTGFVSAATIDFIIDWLEGLEGNQQDALFGKLTSNLILQRRHAAASLVATGLRPFPVDSVSQDEGKAMSKLVPFATYARIVAPRLLALERSEPEPKTMSQVIREWGIADRTFSDWGQAGH